MYQDSRPHLLCGDFNVRCGDQQDFIEGVDEVQHREIIDYRKNGYGDLLIDFLINSNCVMLNGRCLDTHDYTTVSTKGLAVVDYAIVSQHRLHQCKNIKVVRTQELYRLTELLGHAANPVHNISDHFMLMWDLQLCDNEYTDGDHRGTDIPRLVITKYDVSDVPEQFMCDHDAVHNVNSIFDEFLGERATENINNLYSKFSDEVHRSLALTLPVKQIVIDGKSESNTIGRRNLGGQMNCQSYGRLGRRQKSGTAIVTMFIRMNYGRNSFLINASLMVQFKVRKDVIWHRNKNSYCQYTSPTHSGRK